jgi:chromosome segregation ATPase
MSIHNLKQVETFTAFLDFLSDPEKYRKLMVEIKQTAKNYEDQLFRFKAFKDAESYKNQMEADYNSKMDELDKKKAGFEEEKKRQMERNKHTEAKFAEMSSEADLRAKGLDNRESYVKGLENQKEALAKEQVKLEAEKEEFKKVQDNFKKKEVALKAMLE